MTIFINMTEEQTRQIIRQELAGLIQIDKNVFTKKIQILDGRNIQVGRTTGTQIGTASDQKLGFYGVTPVDKPETILDPSGAGTAGVDTPARTAINTIIDRLQELGLIQ